MGFTAEADITKTESGVSGDNDIVPGGDGVMEVWYTSRTNKFDTIFSGIFTNESAFSVPGLFSPLKDLNKSERKCGYGASVDTYGANGLPLDAQMKMYMGDSLVASKSGTEYISVNIQPPPGATSGVGGEGIGTYDLEIEPSVAGIPAQIDDIDLLYDEIGVTQWGSIAGSILDADGNPVANVSVSGGGVSTVSGQDGSYSILGPGGQTVDLDSLEGSITKSVGVNSGEETPVDFQFAGVEVTLSIPGGFKATNAPVQLDITGEKKFTDTQGKATFYEVPLNQSGGLTYFGGVEESVDVGGEGVIASKSYSAGIGIRGFVSDIVTGDPVSGLRASLRSDGEFSSNTDENGEFRTGGLPGEDATLSVADGSRRYMRLDVDLGGVEDGELVEVNEEIERKDNISTY